ncbi:MAG: rhombotarget lipoprotein [Cocleimonas sp.]|nr:rhombotarget lipoprotein [Cocleimonas sp.]
MFKGILSLVLLISLSGCSQLVSRDSGGQAISSSLVDFLYPNKDSRVKHKQEIPVLKLPVKVGIAFLPSQNWRGQGLDEAHKIRLLNKVKASFGKHRFIESISIIPSVYLKQDKGFSTLDRVAKLHDVDVMALVSYDQITQTRHKKVSLLYWTIVGMYVIPGNENSVETFVDTAVFDVRSRKMLLRAPGINSLHKSSTAIDVGKVLSSKSKQGFNLAFDNMIANLDGELTRFRARAKEGKSGVTIQHQRGYSSGSGGGSFGWILLVLLGLGVSRKIYNNKIHTPPLLQDDSVGGSVERT